MDAVTFLQERLRMSKSGAYVPSLDNTTEQNISDVVNVIETWSENNPIRTRQSVFLEQWPEAMIDKEDIPSVCPQYLDRNLKCERDGNSYKYGCGDCRRKFWRKGIE